MGIKTIVNAFYTALSTTFSPTKTITNYKPSMINMANLSGTSLIFVVDKGKLDLATTSTTIAKIDCMIFIQNLKSVSQQDDLLTYLGELYAFFKANARLGGVEMVDITDFDISISEDGINVGLLSVVMTITVQV